ncbi:chorismate mutase [Brevundimonas sp.]|uniref:chorismate mutase n=1 Tax=Brevundimonas sp. TaxID=1871086 RepID=UPI002737B25A|nr:chorismate mutase [Brevundimonas sp.]MDP3803531.1 chorismate mutase [Brevundimonas sp.]
MTEFARRELADLRAELDALDRHTVEALARRQRIVEAIARLKGDPARVRDPERVEAVLANVLQAAGVSGLSAAIAEPVWRLLVERCADHEAAWLQARADIPGDSCCGCQKDSADAGS